MSALCSDQGAAAVPIAELSARTRVQSSDWHSANHIGGNSSKILLAPVIANCFCIHLEYDIILNMLIDLDGLWDTSIVVCEADL